GVEETVELRVPVPQTEVVVAGERLLPAADLATPPLPRKESLEGILDAARDLADGEDALARCRFGGHARRLSRSGDGPAAAGPRPLSPTGCRSRRRWLLPERIPATGGVPRKSRCTATNGHSSR